MTTMTCSGKPGYEDIRFGETVTPHHIQNIYTAYQILDGLEITVSKSVLFEIKPLKRNRRGECMLNAKDKTPEFCITVVPARAENDDSSVNTIIHELLHTVNFKCGYKGIWKRLAERVTINTKYNITAYYYDEAHDTKVNSVIMHMSSDEQEEYINNLINADKKEEIVQRYFELYFWIKEPKLRDRLAIYLVEKHWLTDYKLFYENRAKYPEFVMTTSVKKELAKNYLSGKYDKLITKIRMAYAFDGIYSLTNTYTDVSCYTNARIAAGLLIDDTEPLANTAI